MVRHLVSEMLPCVGNLNFLSESFCPTVSRFLIAPVRLLPRALSCEAAVGLRRLEVVSGLRRSASLVVGRRDLLLVEFFASPSSVFGCMPRARARVNWSPNGVEGCWKLGDSAVSSI